MRKHSFLFLLLGLVAAHVATAQGGRGTSSPAGRARGAPHVDLLLRGGTVVDGTGSAGRVADVGIVGDRVSFVGDASSSQVTADKTLDVKGLVVAPGFIDPHSHTAGD